MTLRAMAKVSTGSAMASCWALRRSTFPETGPSSRPLKRAVAVHEDDGPAIVCTAMQDGRTDEDVAETHEAAEMMQRNLELGFAFKLNAQGFMVEPNIGFRRGHVQGIEELVHGVCPYAWSVWFVSILIDLEELMLNPLLSRFFCYHRGQTRGLQRTVGAARIVDGRRQGWRRGDLTNGRNRLHDFFPQGRGEANHAPPPRTVVEDRAFRHLLAGHFPPSTGPARRVVNRHVLSDGGVRACIRTG